MTKTIHFASRMGISQEEARKIIAQEERDKAAHDGRPVMDGYDYEYQQWCKCAYCSGVPTMTPCPHCGSPEHTTLGPLAHLVWVRCRTCGWTFTTTCEDQC